MSELLHSLLDDMQTGRVELDSSHLQGAGKAEVVTCSGRNGGLQAPDDGIWWARERCR